MCLCIVRELDMWYPEEETQNIVFSQTEGQYLENIYFLTACSA